MQTNNRSNCYKLIISIINEALLFTNIIIYNLIGSEKPILVAINAILIIVYQKE